MDELFSLHGPQSLFLRREALDFGYRDRELREGLRGGLITRIRHGAYVSTAVWSEADEELRHKIRAAAVVLSHGTPLALSHTTAAVHHGLRLYKPDLSRVHVMTLGPTPGRTHADVVYHRIDRGGDDDFIDGDGCMVVPCVDAALQTASLTDVPCGLVTLDSVLDLGKGTLEELHEVYDRHARSPHMRRVRMTLRLTRYGSESAGESVARHFMWRNHLPEPELQYEVRNSDGGVVGRADWGWPDHQLLGEFDGKVKYGALVPEGMSAADVVFNEKKREDRMREASGWPFIRLVWSDLHAGERTVRRIRDALDRGRRLAA